MYGTLMPGHLRWGLLEPCATSWTPAAMVGSLYDTGRGWPAAVVDGSRACGGPSGVPADRRRVPGWLVEVRPAEATAVWRVLDAVEGIGVAPDRSVDPFERLVAATATDGLEAWVYSATRVEAGWTPIERWEGRPER